MNVEMIEPEPELDTMTLVARIRTPCGPETIRFSVPMGPLPQVLEVIERFLRASGFNANGQLDFVKED